MRKVLLAMIFFALTLTACDDIDIGISDIPDEIPGAIWYTGYIDFNQKIHMQLYINDDDIRGSYYRRGNEDNLTFTGVPLGSMMLLREVIPIFVWK